MIDEQNQVPEPEREEEPPVDGAEQEPQQQPADEAFWAELPLEEPEMVLEERDYHPIRRSRTGKTGILGGVMYAVFVICVSVILACMAWMAARMVVSDFEAAGFLPPGSCLPISAICLAKSSSY